MRSDSTFQWLRTGDDAFAAMLEAIDAAKISIRLEMYIFHSGGIGDKFRDGLIRACQRGVRVHVLIDALGSIALAENFWTPLKTSGGHFRWFNRLNSFRFGMRNHRKSLVCDEALAIVGGFNIAPVYQGDGVVAGWRDFGVKISGRFAQHLAAAFDEMFALAEFKPRPLAPLRKSRPTKIVGVAEAELLLSAPGRTRNPMKRALRMDLGRARDVKIICAYFLPNWRIRRDLRRVVRVGGKVQLILAGKSDVPLSRLAARSFYGRLLRAGIEIYEYQPQILHAKIFIIDHAVYAGSANLDTRSLELNYELLVRLTERKMVEEARQIFSEELNHCEKMEMEQWKKRWTFWDQMKGRWARFILARVDPYISRRKWR